MKTAINDAINTLIKQKEYLKEMDLLGVLLENEFIHKSNQINTMQLILENLLEKEKKQIIDALHYFGIEKAEQYYNSIFKQD